LNLMLQLVCAVTNIDNDQFNFADLNNR